jgi:hypothetical protein
MTASIWDPDGNIPSGVAALLIRLADFLNAANGAGMIGDGIVAYADSTVGGSIFTTVFGDGVTDKSAQLLAANALGYPIRIKGVLVIGTPTTITVPIVDTIAQIFTPASTVTIDNGLPVRPEWFGGGENTIHLAGLTLPARGGVIQLRDKTYQRQNHVFDGKYWSKANVTIRGAKMPWLTTDCKALQNGTIIQGTFLLFADNVALENLGVDCGFTYTTTINGSVASDALVCTFNSAAAKAANARVNGLKLHNVIGLCNGPTDAVHAVIACEGFVNTVMTGDTVGVYGIHGVVIKAAGVRAGTIRTYCNGSEGLIIKTDAQTTAIANDIQIDKVVSYANGPEGLSPYAVPSSAAGAGNAGLRLHCFASNVSDVQIGKYINVGYEYGLDVVITPALGYTLDSIQIGKVITRSNGTAGLNIFAQSSGGSISRMHIGSVVARDTIVGAIFVWTTLSEVKIGSFHALNCTTAAAAVSASADPIIDTLIAESCAAAYQITSSGKPLVGKTILRGSTSVYYQTSGGGQSISLSNSWAQVGGGDTFNVIPTHYGIEINGLLSSGVTNVIMTLPQFARPPSEKRFMIQGRAGATQAAIPVIISSAGVVTINDASGSIANVSNYVSLAGISYSLTN